MASTQAEEVVASVVQEAQHATIGNLRNQTPTTMQLIKSHSWSGSFEQLPPTICPNASPQIYHRRSGSQGSKGAVVYSVTNEVGDPCAIIMAWCTPTRHIPPHFPNKVYLGCDRRHVIESLTWNQVEMNLDRASASMEVKDPASRISSEATITFRSHGNDNTFASLHANVELIPYKMLFV